MRCPQKDLAAACTAWILGLISATDICSAKYIATIFRPPGYDTIFADDISGSSLVGTGYPNGGCCVHALLWNIDEQKIIDLNPPGFASSGASAVFESRQVGSGYRANFDNRALMWSGTSQSFVELHPAGFQNSHASDIWGDSQVGSGYGPATGGDQHALLWKGTAASVVDLHPAGFDTSGAAAVFGGRQVGSGVRHTLDLVRHALLWQGSAESVIDLHPAGFSDSLALEIFENTQVGWGVTDEMIREDRRTHALLWRGSAESFVDLHPAGFAESIAVAMNGIWQVGHGSEVPLTANSRALVWTGNADSVVDLHQYLDGLGPVFQSSRAAGVNAHGIIFGSALADDGFYTVLWQPIPEPTTCALSACWAVLLAITFHRRRAQP